MNFIKTINFFTSFTILFSCLSLGYEFTDIDHNEDQHISNFKPITHNDDSRISAFRLNYVMPGYYSDKPDNTNFQQSNPNNKKPISKIETKFQFSMKALVMDFDTANATLYAAYTQKSYWQSYQSSAYFRETNYQPELFISLFKNKEFWGWTLVDTELGIVHQSNGRGGEHERSWNRSYVRQIIKKNNWQFEAMGSIRMKIGKYYNPDIERYLGNDNFTIEYRTNNFLVSLELQNQFSSRFRRGSETLSIAFPLTKQFKSFHGFIQFFSGYGQCLGEYNHYNNSIGIGICILTWPSF